MSQTKTTDILFRKAGFAPWATAIVLVLALAGSWFVHATGQAQEAAATETLVASERSRSEQAARIAEGALKQIYQNIRTLSFLPDIRAMDSHATNIGETSRQTIQQIYNNLASNISVSEVYFIQADFTPGALDPVTGKPQEPALMYDQLIAGNDPAVETTSTVVEQPEVEDEEYALIARQLAYFRASFPTAASVSGLNVPLISGPPVVTCDNTDFNVTLNDYDRQGLVFSVPFYRADGIFGGMVSAVVRLKVLEAILPKQDAALVHAGAKFALYAQDAGQAKASEASVLDGVADPALLFSQVLRLDLPDAQAQWTLWRGLSNAAFTAAPELVGIEAKTMVSLSVIWGLSILAILASWVVDIGFIRPGRRVVHALVAIAGGKIETCSARSAGR